MTDADVYEACVAIFSAGLTAMSLIWGVKQIYRLLNSSRSEG